MPSVYQKASLNALLGLFLEAQGHPLPQHTKLKSASSLSRFLNHYRWSTRNLIGEVRRTVLQQVAEARLHRSIPLRVLIDLTTLEKCGKFLHLSTPGKASENSDPWVRILNGKRGLHLVVLYLMIGDWRIPWSFRIWRGKGHLSPVQLGCRLLANVPHELTDGRIVIVQADTEFGTADFINAVHRRGWRPVVGMRCNRKLLDGRSLKQLYRNGKRGLQVYLEGIEVPLTVSWFWLKRADGQRELRFVVCTHPYSGAYLVRLGRMRWAIEGFFKTSKHRFGLDCFGQSTKLGVYRWLIPSLIAFMLAHWMHQWAASPLLDWAEASKLALAILFPSVIWQQLLKFIDLNADIAEYFGFEIILKHIPDWAYRDWCKI
jgi:hypothetical protein